MRPRSVHDGTRRQMMISAKTGGRRLRQRHGEIQDREGGTPAILPCALVPHEVV